VCLDAFKNTNQLEVKEMRYCNEYKRNRLRVFEVLAPTDKLKAVSGDGFSCRNTVDAENQNISHILEICSVLGIFPLTNSSEDLQHDVYYESS
jgi:hypothetical protein